MAQALLVRRGGAVVAGGFPIFTYTGIYTLIDDGDKNWRIKFLTDGILTFEKYATVDVFVVGGGAGGGNAKKQASGGSSGGGGGGYTKTVKSVVLEPAKSYTVTIGAGGNGGENGGTTSIGELGISAKGGYTGSTGPKGGNGGSGGGGSDPGHGGTDGADAPGSNAGTGQGTTTREFGEETGDLYASGGRGNVSGAVAPGPIGDNTGTGGDGSVGNNYVSYDGNPGYSGIAIIRNHRTA